MQYTLPDIMYDVNCISRHESSPSASYFQGINQLIHYLSGYPHCPIMYPDGLYGTTTHDLCQEVSSGKFHSQHISNVLVTFSDGG